MAAPATAVAPLAQFSADVRAGLSQPRKQLPSKYFYDAMGSALFEAICLLPEYGLTRADERLLTRHAAEIVARLPQSVLVAELGSGSGLKTRRILNALCRRGPTSYYPIEISPKALAACAAQLNDVEHLRVHGIESEYLDGLRVVAAARPPHQHLLVLFLGSTIGNFEPGADIQFLRSMRGSLQPGDALLLGTDLVKRTDVMLAAYNDALRVTAAFNLNLLARINRELVGNFDLSHFQHQAHFNDATSSIEMHIQSKRRQEVTIRHSGLTISMEKGETIWTETCHKYTRTEIARLAAAAGFRIDAQWVDEAWPFAESLFVAE